MRWVKQYWPKLLIAVLAPIAIFFIIWWIQANDYFSDEPVDQVAQMNTPVPTHESTEAPTATNTIAPTLPPVETTAPPTQTPPVSEPTEPPMPQENIPDWQYIDIGAEGDERYVQQGMEYAEDVENLGEGWQCRLNGDNDWTKRDQSQTPDTIIRIPVQSNTAVKLSMCVERGESEDGWTLYLDGDLPETCRGKIATRPDSRGGGPVVMGVYLLPGDCFPGGEMVLVFANKTNVGAAIWGLVVDQSSPGVGLQDPIRGVVELVQTEQAESPSVQDTTNPAPVQQSGVNQVQDPVPVGASVSDELPDDSPGQADAAAGEEECLECGASQEVPILPVDGVAVPTASSPEE